MITQLLLCTETITVFQIIITQRMSKVMGKEMNSFENAQLQRVPLIVRVPGVKGGVQHQYGGEIDVLPTLLHLLGTDTKNYVQFGSDLLSPDVNKSLRSVTVTT